MIEFIPLAVRPDVPTYGAIRGEFTFVITFISERHFRAKYHATVKKIGATKFDGTRIELGYFSRFNDAVRACEIYYRKHAN